MHHSSCSAGAPDSSVHFLQSACLSAADHGPRDQSGRPEEPQIFVDRCYFLLPVCDRKRSPSAVTLHQTVREAIPSAIQTPAPPHHAPGVSSQQVTPPPPTPPPPLGTIISSEVCHKVLSRRQAEDGASLVELPHLCFVGWTKAHPVNFMS